MQDETTGSLLAVHKGGTRSPLTFLESTDFGETWSELDVVDLDDSIESINYDAQLGRLFVWTFSHGVFAFDSDQARYH